MRAIGYTQRRTLDDPQYLQALDIDTPMPRPHDLCVRVHAVAVNPIDLKVYRGRDATPDKPVILGFDAAGVVESIGDAVTRFDPGDAVFYAGTVARSGCNAQLHCVDERLVGHKPETLGFADSASLALTGLTAYELLFDLMHVDDTDIAGDAVLVLGGAGGVASMAIQLLAARTDRPIIATASRCESADWARSLGAHDVIDHRENYAPQLEACGAPAVGAIFSTHTSDFAWDNFCDVITPFGRIGYIDDPETLDIRVLKQKSVALFGEGMFNRSVFATADMARQHKILDVIAQQVDAGHVRATTGRHFGALSAVNLTAAHRFVAGGHAVGKAVLGGFE